MTTCWPCSWCRSEGLHGICWLRYETTCAEGTCDLGPWLSSIPLQIIFCPVPLLYMAPSCKLSESMQGNFEITIGSYQDFIIRAIKLSYIFKTFDLLNKYAQYPEAPLESTGVTEAALFPSSGSLLPVLRFPWQNIDFKSGCGIYISQSISSLCQKKKKFPTVNEVEARTYHSSW